MTTSQMGDYIGIIYSPKMTHLKTRVLPNDPVAFHRDQYETLGPLILYYFASENAEEDLQEILDNKIIKDNGFDFKLRFDNACRDIHRVTGTIGHVIRSRDCTKFDKEYLGQDYICVGRCDCEEPDQIISVDLTSDSDSEPRKRRRQ